MVNDIVEIKEEVLRSFGASLVDLDTLLSASDFISLHVPLTEKTRRLIGREKLERVKPGAFLINTSRGGVVDEEALLDALKSGRLGGAALDVYEEEPPRSKELVGMPDVVCTPHIGAQTAEAQEAASLMLAEKIIEAFKSIRELRQGGGA